MIHLRLPCPTIFFLILLSPAIIVVNVCVYVCLLVLDFINCLQTTKYRVTSRQLIFFSHRTYGYIILCIKVLICLLSIFYNNTRLMRAVMFSVHGHCCNENAEELQATWLCSLQPNE